MLFTDFLQYCLDDHKELPVSAKTIDWSKLLVWAERQAIVGVIFGGIQKAGKTLNIPFDDLMEWIGYTQDIENHNELVNRRCVELVSSFQKDGFNTCILKGQGNAIMYPNPQLRNPGDIDLLVLGHTDGSLRSKSEQKSDSKLIKEIIRYVRKRNPGAKATYHHVEYGEVNGVEVEVHYRPSFMNNLIKNRRLQRFLMSEGRWKMEEVELPDGAGRIPVPSWEFNVVFQLSHIYRHVIQSGLGLRQMIDYYYLLQMRNEK